MNVAVVGLGHIGLPLAAQYASKGHRVIGCDINPSVVEMINAGKAYDDEPGLEKYVADAVNSGLLSAQTDTTAGVRDAEVVVVVVPLMVDANKDVAYNAIDSATRDIAKGLHQGITVIYETTLPVGDTRNRFGPMLEEGSGLKVNQDFSLAFSPERVYVGRVFDDLKNYPKIVGGTDNTSTEKAVAFYRSVLDAEVTAVANAETAEFTKLAETTYRDVNIALANEFAAFAEDHGIDVLQSINAANSQPFSHIHRPGAGVGGHCIPVYPYFYANNTEHADIARLSRTVNDGMSNHVVKRIREVLDGNISGKRVVVFGWAYRENVKEDAFTVAKRLVESLNSAGAVVQVFDPLYTDQELQSIGLTPWNQSEPAEVVVIQAMHDHFKGYDWGGVNGLSAIVDGRNSLPAVDVPDGIRVVGIGRTVSTGAE